MFDTDRFESFRDLPIDKQNFLLSWISDNLKPISEINHKHNSYEMKHWIEDDYPEQYFTNGEFKGAMIASGYYAEDVNATNWRFNFSEQSPYLAKKKAQTK